MTHLIYTRCDLDGEQLTKTVVFATVGRYDVEVVGGDCPTENITSIIKNPYAKKPFKLEECKTEPKSVRWAVEKKRPKLMLENETEEELAVRREAIRTRCLTPKKKKVTNFKWHDC